MLPSCILLCNWYTSFDLKDTHFHIHIYPSHREYLRFAFQEMCTSICSPSFWSLSQPEGVCEIHRCSSGFTQETQHMYCNDHWWLAYRGIHPTVSGWAQHFSYRPIGGSGLQNKSGEQRSCSLSAYLFMCWWIQPHECRIWWLVRLLLWRVEASSRGGESCVGTVQPSMRGPLCIRFSVHDQDAPLGVDALAHWLPRALLYMLHWPTIPFSKETWPRRASLWSSLPLAGSWNIG